MGMTAQKISILLTRPIRVKNALVRILARWLQVGYEGVMIFVDRLSAVMFTPLLGVLVRVFYGRLEKCTVVLWSYKYSGDVDQESIEKICLLDTLKCYAKNNVTFKGFHWDAERPIFGFGIDFYLKTIINRPKVLVLSSYATGVYYQPMPWLLKLLKLHNIKIIALWWDTCSDEFAPNVQRVMDIIDVHAIMENPLLNFGTGTAAEKLSRKSLIMFSPFDAMDTIESRSIDVAFFGQTGDYRGVRRQYLDYMLESGVALYYSAYSKEQQCPQEKYYEILGCSKIGINFSMSVSRPQLKARVFEVMHSGALLLEERNDQIAEYFIEGVDYVAFSTKEEMVKKIKYYLANENERLFIARNGRNKVQASFTGAQFWAKLLAQ